MPNKAITPPADWFQKRQETLHENREGGVIVPPLPTKEEWEAYEAVRESGITNMFSLGTVSKHSGLDKETITRIMKTYSQCKALYRPTL